MKVLFLNYEFPPLGGGSGNANFFLFREFAKHEDINIDLVTSSVSSYRVESFSPNISIHYLDIGKRGRGVSHQTISDLLTYAFKGMKYIRHLVSTTSYDLVHAFFGVPCGYMAMKTGLPYIVSLRGSDVPFHNPRFRWLDKVFLQHLSTKIWRNARAVIANSEGLKEKALISSPQQQISVVHNGVDTDLFRPPEVGKKSQAGRLTLISTGSLKPVKGYDVLLQALQGVESVKLILIGEGPERGRLERMAARYGVTCEFTGRLTREAMISRLQQADVFVLPSLNEGMSNSLLEAMACGLPVIATAVGGVDELVKENGFIIAKESRHALKNAIEQYSNDRSLIEKHGISSCEIAKSLSWHKAAEEYIKLYHGI